MLANNMSVLERKPLCQLSEGTLNSVNSNSSYNGKKDSLLYNYMSTISSYSDNSESTKVSSLNKLDIYADNTRSRSDDDDDTIKISDADDMLDAFDESWCSASIEGYFYPIWNEKVFTKLEQISSKFADKLPELDYQDCWDPFMEPDYSIEIFDYLRELEQKYSVDPTFIEQIQADLTWDDRKDLIAYVVKLQHKFRSTLETLYLTVNIIDRFLSKVEVSVSKLELIAITCFFIAAKYEEVYPPTMRHLIKISSNQFTSDVIREAERFIITTLNFELNFCGPMSFLRRVSKADNYDLKIRTFAKYFTEITLLDHRFIGSPQSWIASGATYMAGKLLYEDFEWTEEHIYYSGYTEEQLIPLMNIFKECCNDYKVHHMILFSKYSDKKFFYCAKYVQAYLSSNSALI